MQTESKKVEEPKKVEVKKEEKQGQDTAQLIKDLQNQVNALKKAQSNAVVETVPGFVQNNPQEEQTFYTWEELEKSAQQELLDERAQVLNDARFRRPGSSFKENESTWVELAVINAYEREAETFKEKGMHTFYEDLKNCNYKKMLVDAINEEDKYAAHLKSIKGGTTPMNYMQQQSGLYAMYEQVVGNNVYNPNSEYNLIRAYREQQKLSKYKYISVG